MKLSRILTAAALLFIAGAGMNAAPFTTDSANEPKPAMLNSGPLTIIAITTAAPGQEKALRAAQEKLVAETVKEPGCIRYELHQSLENGRVLIFVETWASHQQWQDHMQGAAMKRFQATGAGDLIVDFKLHQLSLVADGRQL